MSADLVASGLSLLKPQFAAESTDSYLCVAGGLAQCEERNRARQFSEAMIEFALPVAEAEFETEFRARMLEQTAPRPAPQSPSHEVSVVTVPHCSAEILIRYPAAGLPVPF